jgi:hypothetical protein
MSGMSLITLPLTTAKYIYFDREVSIPPGKKILYLLAGIYLPVWY